MTRHIPIRRLLLGLLLLLASIFAVQLATADHWREGVLNLLEWAGIPAFFIFTIAYNVFIIPFPYDVFLAATPWLYPQQAVTTLVTAIGGIICAAALSYLLGRLLTEHVQRWFGKNRHYPRAQALLHNYGAWSIAFSAILPLPYSLLCWLCGVGRTSFTWFILAAALTRGIRTAVVWYFVWQ